MEIETIHGVVKVIRTLKPKLQREVHTGVNHYALLGLIEEAAYSRRAVPIELIEGETDPNFIDDRTYAFFPSEKVFQIHILF